MRRALLVGLLLVGTASAHVPSFAEAGASPETAFHVDDPTKSWVFYGELDDAQHWFVFEMEQGEDLSASLHLPPKEPGRPTLWIVGPGFDGPAPEGAPEGMGSLQATLKDEVSIEPFSPLAMRQTAQWREPAPATGTFYLLVEGTATYSLGLGARESFTPAEWATIPVERIAIQDWGGVPWPLAVVGEVLGLGAAAVYVRRAGLGPARSFGVLAAGLVAGTSVTWVVLGTAAAVQAGPSLALLVPTVFGLLALGAGYGAFRSVLGKRWLASALWALGSVVVWAGLLVGPAALAGWAAWHAWRQRAA